MEGTIWGKLKKMIAYVFTVTGTEGSMKGELHSDLFAPVSGNIHEVITQEPVDWLEEDVDFFADEHDPSLCELLNNNAHWMVERTHDDDD